MSRIETEQALQSMQQILDDSYTIEILLDLVDRLRLENERMQEVLNSYE
jgi:hypothetical protein